MADYKISRKNAEKRFGAKEKWLTSPANYGSTSNAMNTM